MNLDLATIRTTAIWVLLAITVLAVVMAIIIRKIVGKIITLVVAAIIVFFGSQQRSKVVDYANNLHGSTCASHPTFFGIDVHYPTCP